MTRNRLYSLLAIACFLGFAWLGFAMTMGGAFGKRSVCMFKNVTGYPCPSCGTTRAVMLLLHGHLVESVLMNPLGLIVGALMLLIPSLIAFDLLTGRDLLLRLYRKTETVIVKREIAILLAVLIILNWIWNVQKGL